MRLPEFIFIRAFFVNFPKNLRSFCLSENNGGALVGFLEGFFEVTCIKPR